MVTIARSERPFTVEDLQNVPDDGYRYELIGGQLMMSPAPSRKHQLVSGELYSRLRQYLRKTGKGVVAYAPIEVRFGPYDAVQPDIVVVLAEHADRFEETHIEGAPDLVVEVLSPSSRSIDHVRKAALYAQHGVREYWIVDPDQETVLIQVLRDGVYETLIQRGKLVRSDVLDGFAVRPNDLFDFPERHILERGRE